MGGQNGSPEAGLVGIGTLVKIGVDGGDQGDGEIWFGPLGTVFTEVGMEEAGERKEEHQNSHCGHSQSKTPPGHSDAKVLEAAENTSGVSITVNLGTSGSNVCVERLEHTQER